MEQFDDLLDLSDWMRSNQRAVEETHHCDVAYLDLQDDIDELAEAIKSTGFTYEQVEEFTFSE